MKKIDLTTGNIFSVITTLSIPIIGSSLLQFMYGLIDMLWVGGLGSSAVTTIGSSSFFIGMGYSINSMVVIGTGIKVAHSLGENNDKEVKEYINSGLLINLIIGLAYCLILILFGKKFIGFLNLGDSTIVRNSYLYLLISVPMLFLSFFNTLYIRILNSFGNNKFSLKISAVGMIINIVLDPILIYIFKFGVLGAALATLFANLIMFILFNVRAWSELKFNYTSGIKYNKIIDIIRLGLPMAFQRILFTLVNIILARVISSFGDNAIAAQKIGLQVESVTYMIIGGLNGAISAFTGQNFGARKFKRINEGYKIALKIGFIYSMAITIVFIVMSKNLAEIFVKNQYTIKMTSEYLKIIGVSQIFSMIEMVSNGMFTGISKPNIPSIISIIFTILRIPMALVLSKFIGLNGIWLSITLSSIFKGITAFLIYKFRVCNKFGAVEVL